MPILNDIMDYEVIGPAIRQGLKKGTAEGKREGKLVEAYALAQLTCPVFGLRLAHACVVPDHSRPPSGLTLGRHSY